MEVIKVSPATMLEDEISWLDNFEPSWSSEMETSEADNVLLAGHLRLIKTLLSLCGNEKEHLGEYIKLNVDPSAPASYVLYLLKVENLSNLTRECNFSFRAVTDSAAVGRLPVSSLAHYHQQFKLHAFTGAQP